MTLRQILTAALILAAASSAAGQDRGDYYQNVAANPYLGLSNAAFMDTFHGRIGVINTEFQKQDGNFISLSDSPDSWLTGALTESHFRVDDRLTFYGKIHWHYFEGKDMGAQILMDPEYNPVNFLENTLDTKGVKKRETYSLTGGLSYKLGKRLAAGLKLNYTSADQTKVKDPRFSSIWMDMDANAGISFRFAEKSMLGVSFLYRNTLEQVRGGKFGTTDKQYFIQTDKGGFYGTVTELSGDYNHISDQSARPMDNRFYGIAAQLVINDRFSSQLWARERSGYYGRRSSSTATFFEFTGTEIGYDGKLLIPFGRSLHMLDISARMETLTNNENKFKYVTPSGQSTQVNYTGQDQIMARTAIYADIAYTWYFGSAFAMGMKAVARMRNGKTTLYPFWRKYNDTYSETELWGRYNIQAGPCKISVEASLNAGGGAGTPKEDGSEFEASSKTVRSFDDYLYRQFEYDTARRAGASLSVKCSLPVHGGFSPYISLGDSYTSLLKEPGYLDGRGRNIASAGIGCNF